MAREVSTSLAQLIDGATGAHLWADRFEERAIDAGNRTFIPYAFLAAAEAAKGNDVEAKLALAEARRINPQLTIKWFLENWPVPPMIVEGLGKAGLREE